MLIILALLYNSVIDGVKGKCATIVAALIDISFKKILMEVSANICSGLFLDLFLVCDLWFPPDECFCDKFTEAPVRSAVVLQRMVFVLKA